MNVRDTRVHNYPQRWKAAPNQSAAKIEPEAEAPPPPYGQRWGES
jgi:hypothetical protein